MNRKHLLIRFAKNITLRLSQESLLNYNSTRFLHKRRLLSIKLERALGSMPMAMFVFNQRSILLLFGTAFLLGLAALTLALPHTNDVKIIMVVLITFWLINIALTLAILLLIKPRIRLDHSSNTRPEPHTMIDVFFLIDCLVSVSIITTGNILNLKLNVLAFTLLAQSVAYCAFVCLNYSLYRLSLLFISLACFVIFIYPGIDLNIGEPRWFFQLLYFGPLSSSILITFISISAISWLHLFERQITQQRLHLLGKYQKILSEPEALSSANGSGQRTTIEKQFYKSLKNVLKDVCSLGEPFWYDSACVWIIAKHQYRDDVLLPISSFKREKLALPENGINCSNEILRTVTLLIPHTGNEYPVNINEIPPELYDTCDAPAAFIPLRQNQKLFGLLAFYGSEGRAPIYYQEDIFLESLGYIISSAWNQMEDQYRASSQSEMINLHKYGSLQRVLNRTTRLLQDYLKASGCLVLFRSDPQDKNMSLLAQGGFKNSLLQSNFHSGIELIGKCAETGLTIRCDASSDQLSLLPPELLEVLEPAYGEKVTSGMAIPIGSKGQNYGVLLVVNRKGILNWFTEREQHLGEMIALHLRMIIENILHVDKIERAMAEAKRQSEEAQRQSQNAMKAQYQAEETVKKRQEDIMIITHQLQGPLSSIVGAITNLRRRRLPRHITESLEHIQALVEEGLTVCYGTFTTFALATGRKTNFGIDNVDSATELRKIFNRLRRITSRPDLNFSYYQSPNFPILRIDRNVFISVFHCLLHNVMKYADDSCEVSLQCSFEHATGEAVLKVASVGEVILPNETEKIFAKFGRGQIVEKTGRHHNGVGLGLWVARELMRANGGDLSVKLSPENTRYSKFIVHIREQAPN